jgi:hypothetical protein
VHHPVAKAESAPAIIVRRVQEEVIARAGGYKDPPRVDVRVECRVGSADDGETLEDALDPLTSWAVQACSNRHAARRHRHARRTDARNLTEMGGADTDAVYGARRDRTSASTTSRRRGIPTLPNTLPIPHRTLP